jgi:hypothetical protein
MQIHRHPRRNSNIRAIMSTVVLTKDPFSIVVSVMQELITAFMEQLSVIHAGKNITQTTAGRQML